MDASSGRSGPGTRTSTGTSRSRTRPPARSSSSSTSTRAATATPAAAAGDRAYPASVAIAGGRAFIADEGDGTVASFDLATPSGIQRVTPTFTDPSGLNPKRTHPSGIVASPDAKHVFVSLSNDDQV